MQLKFDRTDLHEFFTRYSVVDSPSAVLVTRYPPENFLGVKFRFFDFAISSYLRCTDVLYLLSVWGRRYSPLDSEHAECCDTQA